MSSRFTALAGTHAVAGVSSLVGFSATFVQVLDLVDAVAGTPFCCRYFCCVIIEEFEASTLLHCTFSEVICVILPYY